MDRRPLRSRGEYVPWDQCVKSRSERIVKRRVRLQPRLGAMTDKQQQHQRLWRGRTLPIIAVAAVHVATVALILHSSAPIWRFVESTAEPVMIFLPEPPTRPETTPPGREDRKRSSTKPLRMKMEAPRVAEPPEHSTTPAGLPPVDWQQAMRDAARKKADETPWQSVVPKADTEPRREFGWSHARTHRIERDADTGVMTGINLNDRCMLVAALMFLPVCQFGKIPARGDLFDGMKDPDRPSSVPDAPKPDIRSSESRSPQ